MRAAWDRFSEWCYAATAALLLAVGAVALISALLTEDTGLRITGAVIAVLLWGFHRFMSYCLEVGP